MEKISVCTIIARNYLALAKTLGDSLRAFHHDAVDFHVLIVDPLDLPSTLTFVSEITLVSPTDIMDFSKFNTLAYDYDVTELSTAVKPFLLEHLLLKGYEKVIYFDPDILVLQPLNAIFQVLDNSNIALVPHILDPIPLDGHFPSEITLLQAGAYNLGFIGIAYSDETFRFLLWWQERLERHCRVAVAEGLFVDQKWIDLVPGMFKKVQILTARGYDVAYWNLNARQLSERDSVYWVDDELLIFFHFSGFKPEQPTQISRHQNRLHVETLPTLGKLLEYYAYLLKANGHDKYKNLPYGYSIFSNGVPMDTLTRSLLKDAKQAGMLFSNPCEVDAEHSFFKWLNSPVAADSERNTSPYVTNYLLGLYQKRLDLQNAFPDVLGRDRNAYLSWVKAEAPKQNIHSVYLRAAYTEDVSVMLSLSESLLGVNVAGYLTAESGVGEAARGYVTALKSLGVKTAFTDFAVGTQSRTADKTLSDFRVTNPHPINLICINADQVPNFTTHVGSNYFEEKYNIGVWWWELPNFPEEWWDRFAHFNEIWVGSGFTYESISKHSPVPVVRIPPAIHVHLPKIYPKNYFGLADSEFIFLFLFDFFGYFERKNPLAVVEAFKKAFQPDEPVRLVFKCINGEHDFYNLSRLKNTIGDARITVIEGYLSKDEKNGLINACDSYVSLHRSEGFGLTLAEAMFLEKTVIATGWSGNMDFMTVNNSYPVEYELTKLTADYGPYKHGQVWAEPSIQHAMQLMRQVYDQPEEAKEKAKRAAADIRLMHSPVAASLAIKARLDVIASFKSPQSTVDMGDIAQDTSSLPDDVVFDSGWIEESRFGGLGRLTKKIMERLIRFYVNHQDKINLHLLNSNQFIRNQAEQQMTLVESLTKQIAFLRDRVDALQTSAQTEVKRVDALQANAQTEAERVDALQANAQTEAERVGFVQEEARKATEYLLQRIDSLSSRFAIRPYMQMPIFSPSNNSEKQSLGYESSKVEIHEQFDYIGFEEVFRGTESFIKKRQSAYVRFFTHKKLVLDVGCGRGEFLELLAEAEIQAVGIDTNPQMVERCVKKGLSNVVIQDCNQYLRSGNITTADGIFSAQFIEHLPFEALYEFLILSREKLTPGGIFIAETVNPHSIEAMKTFYVDLTHIKPLFPEVMLFLCRSAGFSKAQIFYPNGPGFSEEQYWLQGEYAVIAWK